MPACFSKAREGRSMREFRNVLIVYDAVMSLDGADRTVGGIQTYLLSLARVLGGAGLEVRILQEADKGFDLELDDVQILGRAIGRCKQSEKYARLLATVEEDYCPRETLVIWGTFYCAPRQGKYTAVAIQHGIGFDLINESARNQYLVKLGLAELIKYGQRRQAYKAYRNTQYRVCVDYNFLNWYRTMSSREDDAQHWVIPNFTHIPSWPVEVKSGFKRLLFARRFVKARGIDLMVAVAEQLLRRYEDVTVTFAGEGPCLEGIDKLRQAFGARVDITRYDPGESLEFHRGFDIAFVPTVGSEGTSLSLLEAMAAGCAVVCTNVGGMTNIVIDRYNGMMVNPEVASLYAAAEYLIEQPEAANRMRFAARSTVEYGFSHNLWGQKWVAVIEQISTSRSTLEYQVSELS